MLRGTKIILASIFVILITNWIASYWGIRNLEAHADWVAHSHTVIGQTHAVRAALLEVEASQRGYALTGQDADRARYAQALERVLPSLDELDRLTRDNPVQQARTHALREAIAPRLELMRRVPPPRDGNATVLGSDASALLAAVEAEERALLSVRGDRSATSRREAVQALSVEVVLGLGLLASAIVLMRRDARGRARAAAIQRRIRAELEHRVLERTAKLTATAVRLRREVEQRAAASAALELSEARFTAFMDHTPAVTWVKDPDGRFVYANRAFEVLNGLPPAGWCGRTDHDLYPPDDAAEFLQSDREVLADGQPRQSTTRRGDQTWWAVKFALPGGDGRSSLGGVAFDVTARVQAEETLRASEARYRALVGATDQLVWSWSPERGTGDVARQQQWWEDVTGQAPSDQDNDHARWLAVVHPDDRDRVGTLWTRAIEAGTDFATEYRVRARAGGWRHIQSRGVVVRDPNGKIGEWVGALSDVTEQRAAELALRESEERFRQMADAIDQVFWLADPVTGEVLYTSPAFEKVWGFSGEALRERPRAWIEAVHPDDRPLVEAKVRRGKEGERWVVEYRVIQPDGSVRWVRDAGFPICDANGRVQRMAGVARDVTDRRQLEEQFRQSQKMEAVGQLAGGVAHDFNNLLTIINGYSDVLLSRNLDGETRDLITDILEAGRRAAGLTRQLLAFSRRQVLRPRMVDLSALVADLGRMLDRLIGEDIRLVKALRPGLGRVSVDPGQIEQVIVNLVVNARDAMPRGGRLTLATSEVEVAEGQSDAPAGRYAVLTVTDTGIGIPDGVKARIFEPFFTTKEVGQGTGLGLATVLGIVRQSGGHIEVDSVPNRGTTFRIFLPLADGPIDCSETVVTPPPLRGRETILLVEDDDGVRRFASRALRNNGYTVLEAADGRTALATQAAAPGRVDLLITDVIMPEMSGRNLAEQLCANDPGLQVLYISGYTDDAVVRYGVEEASAAFLQKPFSVKDLCRSVRDTIDSEYKLLSHSINYQLFVQQSAPGTL